jgi:hypothetical protein
VRGAFRELLKRFPWIAQSPAAKRLLKALQRINKAI